MPVTNVRGRQLRDDDVYRQDLNTTVSGSAVIRRVIAGTGISLSSTGVDTGTGDVTISQVARTINGVTYDGSANITITANTTNALTFNNGGAGIAPNNTFNGSAAVTVSYNTIGAPGVNGQNAQGNWNINSATATVLQTARTINGVSFNGSADIAVGTLYDTNYKRIVSPGGAEYNPGGTPVTGAFAITLPVGFINSMIKLVVRVYNYNTNTSFDVYCGGYVYSVGPTWVNVFAYITGPQTTDLRYNVRFGTNGTNPVIYIGETNSTWSYPQVYVTEVQVGHGNQSVTWTTGWSITAVTTFGTIHTSVSSAQLGYATSTNTAGAVVLRDASGNFTTGTITATSFVRSGGTASQFLKADGSVDSNTYLTGTGTTNYTARWTGASTLGIGVLYDNGTSVGINTASPAALLDIYTSATTGTTSMLLIKRAAGYGHTLFEQTYDNTYFATGKTLTLKNDSGTAFAHFAGNNAGTQTNFLLPTGNIGVRTSNPLTSLHVYTSTADSTNAGRTTPLNVLTLEVENTSAAVEYAGFGGALVFRGSTYNNATQRTLGRIVHQINDSSVGTQGTSLAFELSPDATNTTLVTRMLLNFNGQLRLPSYTSSTSFTGTSAGLLGIDSSGNVITESITLSGAVTGTGTESITTTLSNSVVGIANLSATGTPSSSTYLRGDNTWATIPSANSTTRYDQSFTATAGQTQITVNNALAEAAFDVYINGVKANIDSFTWSGSTITFVDALAAGDIVDVVNYVTVSQVGTAYGSAWSMTSGAGTGTAVFDTVERSGVALYDVVIIANPNSDGSTAYRDYYYGKLAVTTGYNGAAVVHYIHFIQESPMPRTMHGSGGGNLSVDAVFFSGSSESATFTVGSNYVVRFKISGYITTGTGSNTTVFLKQIG